MSKDKKSSKNEFVNKSNAVCVVVHTMEGAPIPEGIANEIVSSIDEIAKRERYLVNYTRT